MNTFSNKKLLAILSAILILVSVSPLSAFAEDDISESELIDMIDDEISTRNESVFTELDEAWLEEAPAEEQYESLLSNLSSPLDLDVMPIAGDEPYTTLADYYGGAFLNDDKQLVVYVASSDEYILSAFSDASNGAIILSADFTLNQLESAYDELNTTISNLLSQKSSKSISTIDENPTDYLSDICAWTLYQSQNRIVVQINQLNDDKEEYFLNLFSNLSPDMFVFMEALNLSLTETIQPGAQLWSSSSSSASFEQSVGFRAYRIDATGSRVYGFTAAGHGPRNNLYRNGTKVGTLYDSVYTGAYDSAFYDRTTGTILSHTTAYSDSKGGSSSTVDLSKKTTLPSLEGKTIAKVGGKSYYTTGTYKGLTSWNSNGVAHTNLIETTALNLHGDSGGCAFVKDGSEYKIVGQMSASYHTGTSLTETTFTSSVIGNGCHVGTPFDSTVYLY